jgi:hypothetical protein
MYRRLPVALVAACLTVGLAAAPSAVAADSGPSKAKVEKKAKASQSPKTLNRRISSTRRSLTTLTRRLRTLQTQLRTNDGSVKLLLGAAPQLVTGLQTLAAAVQTQIAPGLLQLKAVLENDVGPALRVTIPNAIREVATSQEYGVTGVFVDPTGPTPVSRATTFTSSDVPDDGNTAAASGTLPISVANAPAAGQVPPGTTFSLRSAFRSGESDGDPTGDPAGQVGALMYLKCANAGAACAPGVDAGAILCSVGPTPSNTFSTPNGDTTQSLIQIQQINDRTDQDSPTAAHKNPLAGATASGTGNSTDGSCTVPAAGTYELVVQSQYVDIPTSSSPGATE